MAAIWQMLKKHDCVVKADWSKRTLIVVDYQLIHMVCTLVTSEFR